MVERNSRKSRIGIVVSDKMDKTVVVKVESRVRHPLFGKIIRTGKGYKAHDEENQAREGDKVLIAETRPLSKDKHWRVVKILEKAQII